MKRSKIKKITYWSVILLVFIGVTSLIFNTLWPKLRDYRTSVALGIGLVALVGWPTGIGFLSYYLYERL